MQINRHRKWKSDSSVNFFSSFKQWWKGKYGDIFMILLVSISQWCLLRINQSLQAQNYSDYSYLKWQRSGRTTAWTHWLRFYLWSRVYLNFTDRHWSLTWFKVTSTSEEKDPSESCLPQIIEKRTYKQKSVQCWGLHLVENKRAKNPFSYPHSQDDQLSVIGIVSGHVKPHRKKTVGPKHYLQETAYYDRRYGCLRFNAGNTENDLQETVCFIKTVDMVVPGLMLGTQKNWVYPQ
jgi:hypothetical protein